MSDFLSGLGGLIKGMQPFMGEDAKKDASMNALLLKSEVSELQGKQNEIFAHIGQAVYEAQKKSGRFPEYADYCTQADAIQTQIDAKQTELDAATKASEEKKQAEDKEMQARTCRSCGTVNEPGIKFCSECGGKLGLVAAPKCPKCGAENAPGTRFCGECGGKLEISAAPKCPKCGAENAPGTRFCGECGGQL